MRAPSPWQLLTTALLLILAALTAQVAHNLFYGRAVEVPAAQMLADWQEMQRLAKEHPYREASDGSR